MEVYKTKLQLQFDVYYQLFTTSITSSTFIQNIKTLKHYSA